MDKALKPAPIINKTLSNHEVYKTPILVIAGFSHNSLRMCLETIIMQPGINQEMVYVAYDEKLEEHLALITLFGFKAFKTNSSFKYTDQMEKSLNTVFEMQSLKDKKAIIVIEEELILSPDFLHFFIQLYDTFMADDSLGFISAWNPNGYNELDGNVNKVYRTKEMPGYGFMLKRSVYERTIKADYQNCCNQRYEYLFQFKPYFSN